jgi:hypothetical protein
MRVQYSRLYLQLDFLVSSAKVICSAQFDIIDSDTFAFK